MSENTEDNKPNILQMILSVLAAGFGVQSNKNRERDFKRGSFKLYVILGIIFVILFIAAITSIVSLIIEQAT